MRAPAPRSPLRIAALLAGLLAGLLTALPAGADAPTLAWRVPLPAGQGWRVVDLREGQGIRHEEYLPRSQGLEDYRDRLLVQRFVAQDMSPELYLGHIAAGLARHCPAFTTSGLVGGERDGLPHATRTAYCGRFDARPYGYVIAQKAIRDGDHLFVVEREWRVPPFSVDAQGLPVFDPGKAGDDTALRREIGTAVRWLTEQVHPAAAPFAPKIEPPPPPPPERPRARR